jgi:O-antigen/teichoic acid export membrane protein
LRKQLVKFSRQPFVRNVAIIAGGTAASQVVVLLFAPLITRLYGPEAYGLQAVFAAIVVLASTVSALSYPVAIVLPKSDADAFGLVRLSLWLGLGVSILAALFLHFYGVRILAFVDASDIAPFIYLIPFAMFISVIGATTSQWTIRQRFFSLTAQAGVTSTLLINTLKTGLGFIAPSAAILIVTNVFGNLLLSTLLLLGIRKRRPLAKNEGIGLGGNHATWKIAKRYRDFPTWRTPQNLINAFSANLPILMLVRYVGPAAVGYYAIANAVLSVPSSLVGGSVAQVFYPKVNEAFQRGEDVRRLIIKATIGLIAIGFVPLAIIIGFGPKLFSLVFGEAWAQSGVYAQWLSVWLFFQYVNRPAVAAIPVLGLQRGLLIYELFSTGSKILALGFGFLIYDSDIVAIAFFSIIGAVAYIGLILWVILNSSQPKSEG